MCDREVTEEYNKEILRVTNNILELLSEGLALESNALKSCLGGDEVELEMKINMYPPCPQPELALGVEPHTDMSALTLLVSNDVPGLQVWKENSWVAVNYLQDALFVHIGDQLEVIAYYSYSMLILINALFVLFIFVMVGFEQWKVQKCIAQKLGEQGTQAHVMGRICCSSTRSYSWASSSARQ